jgi:hypothetical protein
MKTCVCPVLAVAGALAVSMLMQCSSTTVAGSGSQAGNGKVECLVTDFNGTAYSNVRVTLKRVKITKSDDSVLSSWTRLTDVDGHCGFDSLPSGSFTAECGNRDSGAAALVSKVYSDMDSVIVLYMEPTITVKGRLLMATGINPGSVSVFVPGCQESVKPDTNGFYVLPNVPLGQHDICFRMNSTINYLPVRVERSTDGTVFLRDVTFAESASAAAEVYSFYETTLSPTFAVVFTAYDSARTPAWYEGKDFSPVQYYRVVEGKLAKVDEQAEVFVVLDDFDDGDSLSNLHPITGHSGWQVVTDAKEGGTTQLLPFGTAQHFAEALTGTGAYSGKSFMVTFLMGTTPPTLTPFSYITCTVSPRGSGYINLSAMTSFTFQLMGKGTVRVVFRSHKALAGYTADQWWGQLSTVLTCPPSWETITIRPSDIKAPPGSKQFANGLTWASVRDSVDRIEFAAWMNKGDTVVMDLDNIVIHGLSDADFR